MAFKCRATRLKAVVVVTQACSLRMCDARHLWITRRWQQQHGAMTCTAACTGARDVPTTTKLYMASPHHAREAIAPPINNHALIVEGATEHIISQDEPVPCVHSHFFVILMEANTERAGWPKTDTLLCNIDHLTCSIYTPYQDVVKVFTGDESRGPERVCLW
jgi:hypothetical protein